MPFFQDHGCGFYTWSVHSEKVKTLLTSTLLIDKKTHTTLLIDPTNFPKNALEEIHAPPPSLILLTSSTHERDSTTLAQELSIPIATNPLAIPTLHQIPQIFLQENKPIHGLTPILLKGSTPGEVALFHHTSKTMIVGDALVHMPNTGFSILPEKYCDHWPTLKKSLEQLLQFDFERLFFAHGSPLLQKASLQLQHLLKS